MPKTILITGSTDGIGLETAKHLAGEGHHLLLHGRSQAKLDEAERQVLAADGAGTVDTFCADLSDLDAVAALADEVIARHRHLDVLVNNAGVFRIADPITDGGLDVRFVVNVLAPYVLARRLLPAMDSSGRIVNLSSAAQASVDPAAFAGRVRLDDGNAYAQSKLAITMWSRHMARELGADGPVVVAVNPGSFLGTKMVKEAYGTAGNDIGIGVDILTRAALSEEFADASGRYFDNDAKRFADPHPDALSDAKNADLVSLVESMIGA